MVVKIVPNETHNPPGKLSDAELHFTDGVLDGLKLIGFSVWERRSGGGRNVTFPARQYAVNGERRSFALLRPIADVSAQERIRDLVLHAYAEYEDTANDAALSVRPLAVAPLSYVEYSASVNAAKNGVSAGLVFAETSSNDFLYAGIVAGTAGITLYELSPQSASLEDAFMELTREASEYHAGGDLATTSRGAAA